METLEYSNGEKYVGEVKDGKKHGKGTYTWFDGKKYEGEFVNDTISGKGKCSFPTGDVYEGEFVNGLFDGSGKMEFKSGFKYEGDWKNGQMNGRGVYTYPDGSCYEGVYNNGLLNGSGKFTSAKGDKYEGSFVNGKFSGEGVMDFADGRRYEGHWNNGQIEGFGRFYMNTPVPEGLVYSNGEYEMREYFEGNWENGTMKGEGIRMFGALPYSFMDGKPYLNYNNIDKPAEEGTKACYIAQSGFWIQMPSATLIFDWYLGSLPPTRKDKKVIVFISHRHGDHYNPDIFRIGAFRKDVMFVFGSDAKTVDEIQREVDRKITENNLDDEDYITAKVMTPGEKFSLKNPGITIETFDASKTDMGVSFLVEIDGKTIYHSGDLALIAAKAPDNIDSVNMAELGRGLADQLFPALKGRKIDYAMLAMDPRFGTCGLLSLAAYLGCAEIKNFSPMHLWGQYDYPQVYAKTFPETAKEKMIMPVVENSEELSAMAKQAVEMGDLFDPFS